MSTTALAIHAKGFLLVLTLDVPGYDSAVSELFDSLITSSLAATSLGRVSRCALAVFINSVQRMSVSTVCLVKHLFWIYSGIYPGMPVAERLDSFNTTSLLIATASLGQGGLAQLFCFVLFF